MGKRAVGNNGARVERNNRDTRGDKEKGYVPWWLVARKFAAFCLVHGGAWHVLCSTRTRGGGVIVEGEPPTQKLKATFVSNPLGWLTITTSPHPCSR